ELMNNTHALQRGRKDTNTQLSHFEPRPHHLHTPLTNKQKIPPHRCPTDAPDTKPATALPDMLLTQLLADAPVTELAETVAATGEAGTKGGMSGAKLAPRGLGGLQREGTHAGTHAETHAAREGTHAGTHAREGTHAETHASRSQPDHHNE